MIDNHVAVTLERLHRLNEQAILRVGPQLDRTSQLLEGRRRIATASAFFVMARGTSSHIQKSALRQVGWHIRRAQEIVDRELAGDAE